MGEQEGKEIRNMQQLIDFAKRYSGSSAGPVEPLSEEKAQFLRDALKAYAVDIIQVIKDSINVFKNLPEDCQDLSEFQIAVDNVLDFIEKIDYANDFVTLKGLDAIRPLLSGAHCTAVKTQVCRIVSVLVQNNPVVQQSLSESEIPQIILGLAKSTDDQQLQLKSFQALSAYARNNRESLAHFAAIGGKEIVLRLLNSSPELVEKASFFLASVTMENPNISKLFFDSDVEFLAVVLNLMENEETFSVSSYLIYPLECYLKNSSRPEKWVSDRIRVSVGGILSHLAGKEQFYDGEIECCKSILSQIGDN